ncbi:MAG: pentapeptide repeat-containing protein [Pseudomonadota bacterium]
MSKLWERIKSTLIWIFGPSLRIVWRAIVGSNRSQWIETGFLRFFLAALVLIIAAAIAVLGFGYSPFPNLFEKSIFPDGRGLNDSQTDAEILRNLLFALAGFVGAVFGLFQLYNAARRTRISEDQVRVAFEAERNQRYVSAAELLKDKSPAVRIAGITALKRLGLEQDSKYRETVIELLAGFIRAETSQSAQKQTRPLVHPVDREDQDPPTKSDGKPLQARKETRPTESVSKAFEALSALTSSSTLDQREQTRLGSRVDLRNCNLAGLDQPNAQMVGWDLSGSNLTGAVLIAANLTKTRLFRADLSNACLAAANMTSAELRASNLTLADLFGALLEDANLAASDLTETSLETADLNGAILEVARNVSVVQLAQARNVIWPKDIPRPKEGPYSEDDPYGLANTPPNDSDPTP